MFVRILQNVENTGIWSLEFQTFNFDKRRGKYRNVSLFLVRFFYHVYICDAP